MSIFKEGEKRNVCVAMTIKDYERMVKHANKQDMSASAFIRFCIRRELERGNSNKS